MFWRFGSYANVSTIDSILDKSGFILEDLLDEGDLIQELKQHNTKLIEFLREQKVLEKLLEYVVAPRLEPVEHREEEEKEDKKGKSRLSFSRPRASSRVTNDGDKDEEEVERKRNKYAYVAAELLSSENWSIYEALMENPKLLRHFWGFLKRDAPLDPLQASYFTKVNEALFDKKTDEMLELLRSLDDAVPDMLRHVDCPMIMDLLLKIISLERTENGQGIVEWLYTKDVMPTLLSFLGPEYNWATQTSAGDFMKAIITVSANASQNEQACIGPNELTRQLVSKPCVERLVGYMLSGGNPLTVGVGIIIEVIRKNNSDYDPEVSHGNIGPPSSRDPIYLGTLLRLFAEHVPDFMNLIRDAPSRHQSLQSTFGKQIEPLGFDRFKTCELMAELLHCSNMALLNEAGSEQIIAVRDQERRRLRAEGRLATARGEGSLSSDDLIMHAGRHSCPDDGRRLEVTNASDDDGFEEVAPAGEMTDDTSHEFVNAEEEIRTGGPAASFLDKDDDDFVDEPLSSPRLHVNDGQLNEQQFENPEMMVAPLSPQKTGQVGNESSADRSEQDTVMSDPGPEPSKAENTAQDEAATGGSEHETTAHLSEPEPKPDPIEWDPDVARPEEEEDTTLSTGSTIVCQNNEASSGADHPMPDSEAAEPSEEESIIVGHEVDTAHVAAYEPANPVVGDFLKQQFVAHNVVPTILSFFFKYPWNNFLHNVVYDIVQQVFNGPMDRGFNPRLAISLFESADITNAVIQGQLASEKSQTETRTRMGYMGHLTLIAEEVVKFTERNPPELLSELVLDRVMSTDWINYVEGALAETRERDNAILGGVRPDVAMSNRAAMTGNGLGSIGAAFGPAGQSGSAALAAAGLTGLANVELGESGNGNSLGPFSISSGLLGSGFGSSSDEDEDEAEETEEDVDKEFQRYADNLTGMPLEPPSMPPPLPPAPLNIPPSRARLQLAARLAMHQRNAEVASQSAQIEDRNDVTSASEAANSGIRNPFDDDAEDEVDEDSDDGFGEDGSHPRPWNSNSKRSWWRNVVQKGGNEKFDGGKDDFDSDKDDQGDNSDEEFGEFAMPESKEGAGEGPSSSGDKTANVIVKPLPLHTASSSSGPKTSGFPSLWPFGGPGFGSREKEKAKAKGEEGSLSDDDLTGDDGEKIKSTHEARSRTSIEDLDDEEVVV